MSSAQASPRGSTRCCVRSVAGKTWIKVLPEVCGRFCWMIIAHSLRGVPLGGGGAAHVAFVTPRECRDGASGHHHICLVVEVFRSLLLRYEKRWSPRAAVAVTA